MSRGTNHYSIRYTIDLFRRDRLICVPAQTKTQAYFRAVDAIRQKEGYFPSEHYVESVTYQNGNVHHFKK